MARTIPRCTRLAVKAGPPPTVVVEYDCPTDDGIRIDLNHRRKTIRLHNLATSSDSAETITHRLGRKFPRHLGPKVVNHAQLQGLILKLQYLVKTGSATCTKVSQTRSAASGVPKKITVQDQDQHQDQDRRQKQKQHEGDLNLASENELAAAKMRMNVIFEQNLRRPGSEGYIHDVRRDFDQAEEECDWDEESS